MQAIDSWLDLHLVIFPVPAAGKGDGEEEYYYLFVRINKSLIL